ncbi:hypothetical protein ASD64_15805 [Mesorhizobium sp. Root157]|nr:hypothetical protein ASD64_15805 [Mesorhizobium sp. Root157]
MNGSPPLIRLAYRDEDGELQLMGTHEISIFGCVPQPGDVIRDTLVEWCEPYRVRRRIFIPMTAEPDIWWLMVDRMADDREVEDIVTFDAEMRAEFKELDEEIRREQSKEFSASLRKLTLQKSKRPSAKKLLKEEFGED